MFTNRYRYGIVVLLGAYSYFNTLFTNVYHYYGIGAPWYDVMGTMIVITLVVWEANRGIAYLLQRYAAQWATWRFLFVCFITGMAAAALLSLAISYIAAGWLGITGDAVKMGMKLAFTYGTRINLFLHIINGIFIFNRQYKSKELETEELKRMNAQAQLQAIKNQVNPHFLFNNLNVLSGMVIRDNPEANTFIEEFSKVYRHILNSQDKELVPLSTELEFIKPYIFLLEKRFPESISIQINVDASFFSWLIVPASLQMLIENAIKHNILSAARPLQLTIAVENNAKMIVSNNLQVKLPMENSTQLGLKNIAQRYELIAGEHIEIRKNERSFAVSTAIDTTNSMTTIIIEDEKIAADRLQLLLQRCAPQVQVLSVLDTVEASIAWLNTHPPPDFILLDIHLADGFAFEIFRQVNVLVPVIFTTAYDQYSMEAFKLLSIDYLLKPVTIEALSFAIQKLHSLRQPQVQPVMYNQLLQLLQQAQQKYKTRFVGKVGQKLFFIDIDEIAYFLSDNKIVCMYTCDGNHYVLEYTLEALEKLLNPDQFFRVNRSVIVKAKAIEQVKPYINSRLKIIVRTGNRQSEAIVSRDRVAEFKNWANN